jgi:hypothetical protein
MGKMGEVGQDEQDEQDGKIDLGSVLFIGSTALFRGYFVVFYWLQGASFWTFMEAGGCV